jgi:hypothetical protein
VKNNPAAFVDTDAANVQQAHPEKILQISGTFPPKFGQFGSMKKLARVFWPVFGQKTVKSFGKSHIVLYKYEIVFHRNAFWGFKF